MRNYFNRSVAWHWYIVWDSIQVRTYNKQVYFTTEKVSIFVNFYV